MTMKHAPSTYTRFLLTELAMLVLVGSLLLPWGSYPSKHPVWIDSGTHWGSSKRVIYTTRVRIVDQNGAAVIDPMARVIQQPQDIHPHTVSGVHGKTQRWLPGMPFYLAPILVGFGITMYFSRWPRLSLGPLCAGLALTVFFMLDLAACGGFAALAIGGWLCLGMGALGMGKKWEVKEAF